MVVKVEKYNSNIEYLLWILIAVIAIAAIASNFYFFSVYPLLFKLLSTLIAAISITFLFGKTNLGKKSITLFKEALAELRKVVWPSKQETINSVMAVGAMVAFTSILLGLMDWVLNKGLKWFLSIGGV